MKSLSVAILTLVLITALPESYSCTWAVGYFYQVSALRGSVVGAKLGLLQYVPWLRQSFARKDVTLSLYQYQRPRSQPVTMRAVKTAKADSDGRFDFGAVGLGHYSLLVEDSAWGTSDWFDVEVKQLDEPTVAVTIDVSPHFPDCKGGHEFIVMTK